MWGFPPQSWGPSRWSRLFNSQAPLRQLTTVSNSSHRKSRVLFWPLRALTGMWFTTFMKVKYPHIQFFKQINKYKLHLHINLFIVWTAFGYQFSPFTMWVPRIQRRSLGLVKKKKRERKKRAHLSFEPSHQAGDPKICVQDKCHQDIKIQMLWAMSSPRIFPVVAGKSADCLDSWELAGKRSVKWASPPLVV